MKVDSAVPTLIGVLERKPASSGAANALGMIGDKRGIPILLKILEDGTGVLKDGTGDLIYWEIVALGMLKARKAVPILIKKLGALEPDAMGWSASQTQMILNALRDIGDDRAIKPIEKYLTADHPEEWKRMAKKVLVQLRGENPVEELAKLFDEEPDEFGRWLITQDLGRYPEKQCVEVLGKWGSTSEYERIRSGCIDSLSLIGTKDALLELTSLLDADYPEDLKEEFEEGDPAKRLRERILRALKKATGQDMGEDAKKWREWIEANMSN